MKKFDKIFQETIEQFLQESPSRIGFRYPEELDVEDLNKEYTKELLKTVKPQDQFENDSKKYLLYREHETEPPFVDNWIFEDRTCAQFNLKVTQKGLHSLGVWNSKNSKGLCRALFFDYYLEKFETIISDISHTDQGENYWKKLLNRALNDKKYTTFAFNEFENLKFPITENNLNSLWDQHNRLTQLVIQKRK